jgi:nitrite reductase (NADH) small subunit
MTPPAATQAGQLLRLPLSSLLPEQGRRVASPWGELAVFLLEDGSVRAILNRCPHRQGSLAEGIVAGNFVFCTQHDWKICLSDGQAQAPDHGCTQVFHTKVEGQDLLISKEDLA